LPRRLLLAGTAALGGCSVLPQPKYAERTEWPLVVRRPSVLAPRTRGKVLVVRDLTPAPGVERRGVQWLRPDGSLHVDFYNQWAVPPAEGITDDLRRWLASSGLFAAVVGPDSGLTPDLVLEGEVTAFLGEPSRGVARVALALVLIRARATPAKVLMQRTVAGEGPIRAETPAGIVAALLAALGRALAEAEAAVRNSAAP
jgi:cholesterol transport system auxiliary component